MRCSASLLLIGLSLPLRLAAQTLPTIAWAGSGSTQTSGTGTQTFGTKPWLLLLGDSKTASYSWPGQLVGRTTPRPWFVLNAAVSGRTVQTTVDNLTALLAAATITTSPPIVLVNLGVNDFGAATFNDAGYDVTWRANLLTILDAVRVRWPTAPVYIVRAWSQGNDTKADTLAGWITTVVAARANTFVGDDERVTLKGADDGATNTSDGVHPTGVGNAAIATAWTAILWP